LKQGFHVNCARELREFVNAPIQPYTEEGIRLARLLLRSLLGNEKPKLIVDGEVFEVLKAEAEVVKDKNVTGIIFSGGGDKTFALKVVALTNVPGFEKSCGDDEDSGPQRLGGVPAGRMAP
jgi:hypothetical protein